MKLATSVKLLALLGIYKQTLLQ